MDRWSSSFGLTDRIGNWRVWEPAPRKTDSESAGLSRFPYCLLHQLYAKLPDLRYMGVITWHCRRSSWTPKPRQSTAKGIPRSPSLSQLASAHSGGALSGFTELLRALVRLAIQPLHRQ